MYGVILRSVLYIKLKLHCVKVKKLNVSEWRVFAEPVTYVVTSSPTTTTNLSPYVAASSKTNPFQRGSETQIVNSEGQTQSLVMKDHGSKN